MRLDVFASAVRLYAIRYLNQPLSKLRVAAHSDRQAMRCHSDSLWFSVPQCDSTEKDFKRFSGNQRRVGSANLKRYALLRIPINKRCSATLIHSGSVCPNMTLLRIAHSDRQRMQCHSD